MQRITNITAIFACLVIGTALLVSNTIGNSATPQIAKVKERKVGDLSNKEMAKLYGGVNGQRCWESSDNCPSPSSSSCYVMPHNLQPGNGPCAVSDVTNGAGGKYYQCQIGGTPANYEHCGTSSTVYCQKKTTCMVEVTQGYSVFEIIDMIPSTRCQHETGYGSYCGSCEGGSTENVDGHSSQRCVPD
ncbi:hypothetical protein FACS1894189_9190 [Planctomycetales bacterium]|nr:hypothetical protein FACS1894189_9190 [Planctomycetales bacterium]